MEKNEFNQRLVELETRIAFQEQSISELSEVIVRQQTEIDQISYKMQRMAGRLASVEEFHETGSEPEPPPPHY